MNTILKLHHHWKNLWLYLKRDLLTRVNFRIKKFIKKENNLRLNIEVNIYMDSQQKSFKRTAFNGIWVLNDLLSGPFNKL